MSKEVPQHKDRLGRILELGDCVAFPNSNNLAIGTIKKINPVMVKVGNLSRTSSWTANKYPQDTVKLEGADVTLYLLKNSGRI